ncbi:phosphate acetyltransferase [Candidatus Peregrinibacteria bacterium CG_4_10_14_0_2_um_filter_38_24]|nr:MAG: phosphate acetyltransferase [Candidatus Peregrinibacteria bacterium CG_4_10_14_0_2_um_filter_38_24]PJC38789.1 MAG: phosphate acetyltransferase [Candidatus Peregrinibacteria bacterium CG_4_9_14_0_2_um_filter_38_9]
MANSFIKRITKKAHYCSERIVLPEGTDERILKAIEVTVKKDICQITLIGLSQTIKAKAKKLGLEIDWEKVRIEDPQTSKLTKTYTETLYELRKHKGVTMKDAKEMIQDIHYFGTMMVYMDDVDGMVSGATCSTAQAVRPALEIIKTKEKFHKVSGIFFMVFEKKLLLFADAAITVNPNASTLVDIAIDTAETAKRFGIKPKVAMLSFSTKGSAKDPELDKIRKAVATVRAKRPDLIIDGEIQVDAAIVPEVAKMKCPDSVLKGDANVLIFPNLAAANIAYKLVEKLAKAHAIGPFLQGLKKPVNDLSRGCNYKDIIDAVSFTAYECCVG